MHKKSIYNFNKAIIKILFLLSITLPALSQVKYASDDILYFLPLKFEPVAIQQKGYDEFINIESGVTIRFANFGHSIRPFQIYICNPRDTPNSSFISVCKSIADLLFINSDTVQNWFLYTVNRYDSVFAHTKKESILKHEKHFLSITKTDAIERGEKGFQLFIQKIESKER